MLNRDLNQHILSRLQEPAPLLQILMGPRQVGKTTAATQIYTQWTGPKLMATADIPNPPSTEWIAYQWQQLRRQGPGGLLILDEIQKIPNWSNQIKALFDPERERGHLKVLLLGSSSLYLQHGLAESLAGRFELIHAPHWSYRECHEAFGWDLETYLRFGGYPGAARFQADETRWRDYILHSIIEPVLSRDLLEMAPRTKPSLFRQAFELVVQYPAQIVSFQKLLGQLQDRGNTTTIKHYLTLLEQAFLIRCLPKYSGSVLQSRGSSPKIVVLNSALTHAYQPHARLTVDPSWYGFVFESMIGAQLAQHESGTLSYWRDGHDEVDYVLAQPDRLLAIEVKSGLRPAGRGLVHFARRYPHAACQLWDANRCREYLETGRLPG